MNDVSGFGLKINLTASATFPNGLQLTQFADDADPFDLPNIKIADTGMGLNGDMLTWAKATPSLITINVIPGSEDDRNLAVIFDANRVSRGHSSAGDVINCVGIYPDGTTVTARGGVMTDGPPGSSVASAGRLKSKAYMFAFEDLSRTD